MKHKVAIIHGTFEEIGGGERLVIDIIDILRKNGFETTLFTGEVDKEKVKKIFHFDLDDQIKIVTVKSSTASLLYKLRPYGAFRLRRIAYRKSLDKKYMKEIRESYDISIDTQLNMPSNSDISYIHFPITIDTYSRKGLKRKLYNFIVSRYISSFKNSRPGMVLTNSKWTASKVYKEFGIVADVLYPPVDIRYFSNAAYGSHEEKSVVTISRFTPEKGLEN
ncbi:MAG: hypothetical protein G5Z43_000176, partial [Caldisphaeraceae archaeon]|nr:hypothetical protein [Caldisphaeraceae archaeon]